jgi:hypothetical protein
MRCVMGGTMFLSTPPGTTRILLRPNPSSDSFACVPLRSRGTRAPSFRPATPRPVGQVGADRTRSQQRDMHARALQLTAQRLAERVDERLTGRVGGVVGNRRIAGRRTGNQNAAHPAFDHPRQHGQDKVMHAKDIQCNLGFLFRRIKGGDRAGSGYWHGAIVKALECRS